MVLTKGMQGHIISCLPTSPAPDGCDSGADPPPQQLESSESRGSRETARASVLRFTKMKASASAARTTKRPRPRRRRRLLPRCSRRQCRRFRRGPRSRCLPVSTKLVAEHSRGDVGIEYQVHLGSEVLLPGMSRELPTPVVLPVSMPWAGTLRLRTEGKPTRHRLFDGERLVFESAESAGD